MNSNANPKSTTRTQTKKLVLAAVFVALSLALKPFTLYLLPVARLSFIDVPIIMSGILLGPLWGAAVGVITDIAGYLFFDTSGAALNPIISLGKAFIGFVPGLIFMLRNKGKKINCNFLNILSYIGLLVLILALCLIEGSISIKDGAIGILSPASGEYKVLSWWAVGSIIAAFILYSVVIIRLMAHKGMPGKELSGEPKAYILLSTTLAVLMGNIIIEGTALALMYGWKLGVMYVIKIAQGFLTIPVYSILCTIMYPVIKKQKI